MLNVIEDFLAKYGPVFCLIGILGITTYVCVEINASNTEYIKKIGVTKKPSNQDTCKVKLVQDFMEKSTEGRLSEVERIVKNYQGDANVVIVKANDMVTLWLEVSSGFVLMVIGLSVWNNHLQEKKVEKVRRELECTAQMNKIASVMTCLNCLPDPLLSDSEDERRSYVRRNIVLLHREFNTYIKLVNKGNVSMDEDLNYVQLVLSVLKIAMLRVQSVFSDKVSNVSFYTLSSILDKCIKSIQNGDITHKNLRKNLKDIQSQFDKLLSAL